MANNIKGINRRIQPSVVVRQQTLQRASAANGGARILCIIGEGETEELLVSSARGGGVDGVNADYSGSNLPDGRHFKIAAIDLVKNRTQILKNGSPLTVLETTIDNKVFDARYDARVDPLTGRIELQRSHLVSVGGTSTTAVRYYTTGSANVGTGNPVLTSASLVNANAPAETWTARVVGVVKDGYGATITGQASITVSGSTSGVVKDAAGNPIRWKSDGVVVSNGLLSFSFVEGSVKFAVGDRFTINVDSGVLSKNDELSVRYIAHSSLNSPELFSSASASNLFAKFGDPSVANSLSLGVQMAIENGAPQIMALQAKPPIPRRTSFVAMAADNPLTSATEGATGAAGKADTLFPLPLDAKPDADTEVHLFVVNADNTETQLVLSKTAFYNSAYNTEEAAFTSFVSGPFSQSYTLFEAPQVEQSGLDGYVDALTTTTIMFSSPTAAFSEDRLAAGEGDVDKLIRVLRPSAIAGEYTITGVSDGYGDNTVVYATKIGAPITATVAYTGVSWQVEDPSTGHKSVQLAITDDVALNNLAAGKGLRISYIDHRDADFFDTNWAAALQELEGVDCQIIVPLPSAAMSNVFQAARVHVENMSSVENGMERFLIVGALDGLVPNNLIGRSLAAVEDVGLLEGVQGDDAEEVLAGNIEDLANYSVPDAFGRSFRVTYMAPDRIIRNIAGTNTTLPGCYLAACAGGLLAAQSNVAEPITFKILTGFTILRDRVYRRIVLDDLADAGVTVVQPVAGGGKILHGLTTSQSGAPEDEEVSIVFIRDQVARMLRRALSSYVGVIENVNLVSSMTATVSDTLSAAVSQGLLTRYGQVSVARDPSEPRQFNVGANVAPTAPIDWISVVLTIAL